MATINMVNMATITLDLDEQQCFHEHYIDQNRTDITVKLSIIFDVIAGDFNDINFHLKNIQTGNNICRRSGISYERLFIALNDPGTYEYCFDNDGQSVSQSIKWIRFNVILSTNYLNAQNQTYNVVDQDDEKQKLIGLNQQLYMIKYEAEIQRFSLIVHHEINEYTNYMLTVWSAFESSIIVLIVVFVFYCVDSLKKNSSLYQRSISSNCNMCAYTM